MAQTLLVTGVSSGFGLAVARVFLNLGWQVVGTARRKDRLDALTQELGSSFLPLCFDVRNKDAVFQHLQTLPQPFHEIDVLVNNAGLALGLEPAQEANLEDWETMVDTNIKGLMYCTRALVPAMAARGKGHIVNIGSIAGTYPYPGGNVYGATKAFVEQFSLNLRTDLHGTGVRVTSLEPGLAESEFSVVRFKGDQSKADKVYTGCQALTPEDIAEAVRWVALLPQHVNINRMEVMPTCQSNSSLAVFKKV